MKKNIFTFILFFLCFPVFSQNNDSFERFYSILIKVESGGKSNAIGDNGKAIGPAQIHKVYWQDATSFDKSIGGKYEDCFNKDYSKNIVRAYMNRYCKNGTFEQMARCHNSGPDWKRKYHLTNSYWRKFQKNS